MVSEYKLRELQKVTNLIYDNVYEARDLTGHIYTNIYGILDSPSDTICNLRAAQKAIEIALTALNEADWPAKEDY